MNESGSAPRALDMPLAADDGFIWSFDGDWLLVLRFRHDAGWDVPANDVTFERELVCS